MLEKYLVQSIVKKTNCLVNQQFGVWSLWCIHNLSSTFSLSFLDFIY